MAAANHEVIVLGLGAMGSAALYQLSKQGVSALGIDRFSPPHDRGSSHGDTRITRQAIGEGDVYTPLALRSYEIWDEIEKTSGADLLTITGGIIIASPAAPGTAAALHGKADFMGNTLRSAQSYNIAHETLTASEISRRFEPFKLRGDETGYFEEKAGFLRPERCVAAQLQLARQNGALVHVGEQVLGFFQEADGVTVQTDKGTYRSEKLIITAGPWVGKFMPAACKNLFKVYRQVLYWFDVSENYPAFVPERFPVFIWDFGTGESIYGFPSVDGRHGGLKVAHEEYFDTLDDPVKVNRDVSHEETRRMFEQFVKPRLAGVGEKCLKTVSCLYTVTPDSGFVLDVHPDCKDVIIASPCSGHGFKHSAAIGGILAQMATVGKSDIDIHGFSLKRFG